MQRQGFSLIDQKLSELYGFQNGQIFTHSTHSAALCASHFPMKACSYSFHIAHKQYIVPEDVQRKGFRLIDQKLSELYVFQNGQIYTHSTHSGAIESTVLHGFL